MVTGTKVIQPIGTEDNYNILKLCTSCFTSHRQVWHPRQNTLKRHILLHAIVKEYSYCVCIKRQVYYLLGHRAESSKLNLAALHIKETLEDPSPPWLPLVAPSDGQLKHPAESSCCGSCTFYCWEWQGTQWHRQQAKPIVLAAILHSITMSMMHSHSETQQCQCPCGKVCYENHKSTLFKTVGLWTKIRPYYCTKVATSQSFFAGFITASIMLLCTLFSHTFMQHCKQLQVSV